jgi:hypothetical protein
VKKHTTGGTSPCSLLDEADNWRHVLSRLMAHAAPAQEVVELLQRAKANQYTLLGPFAVASAIEMYGCLSSARDALRVAIIGAERTDAGIDGRLYALLPWLLGRHELMVSVELVGPEYEVWLADEHEPSTLPRARTYNMKCGAWWKKRVHETPTPDVFFVFHPGLEGQAKSWLAQGELPTLLRAGKTVIFFSYDIDEAERDAAVLAAHGSSVSAPLRSPLNVDEPPADAEGTRFTFAGASFSAKGFEARRLNRSVINDMENLSEAIQEVFSEEGYLERHRDAFRRCVIWRKSEFHVVAHVFGRLYYDPERCEMFLAAGGREIEEWEPEKFDKTSLDDALSGHGTPLDRALLAASVFRAHRPKPDQFDIDAIFGGA